MNQERTFHQINEQEEDGKKPAVLIYNRGNFYPAILTDERNENGLRMARFVNEEGDVRGIPGNDDAFSDAGQAMLAEAFAKSAGRTPEEWSHHNKVVEDIADVAIESAGVEKPKLKLRAEDVASAENRLAKLTNTRDEALRDMLKRLGDTPSEIRAALDPNTGNEALRKELLSMIERRIDSLGSDGKLPERVQRNSSNDKKATDMRFNHVEKMSPREYASRLALAMLDGSFDDEKSKASRYDDLPADSPHNGQHRQSAEMLLGSLYADSKQYISPESEKLLHHDVLEQNRERFEQLEGASRLAMQRLDMTLDGVHHPMVDLQSLADVSRNLLNTLQDIQTELSSIQVLVQTIAEDDPSSEDYITRLHRLRGRLDAANQHRYLGTLNRLSYIGTLDSMEVDQLRIYATRESEDIRQLLIEIQRLALDAV